MIGKQLLVVKTYMSKILVSPIKETYILPVLNMRKAALLPQTPYFVLDPLELSTNIS